MRKKSMLTVLSVVIFTVLSLSALSCSSSGPTQTAAAQPSSSIQPSPSPVYAGELMVFAAAGTKPAVDEASKLFEQKYGTKIAVNYGGGGEVLSAMMIGKTGDVYIAPEQRFMDSAKKQGVVDNQTAVHSPAYMIPVIGVKKGNPQNIRSLADLAGHGLRIVMCNPETTALGVLAPEILQKAGVYEAVKPNVITNVPQVPSVIAVLKMNQADSGLIWHYFGTTSANDVDTIWIPREYVTGIGEIQAAVSTYSREVKTAEQFIYFLTSPEGREIFRKNGYITDRQEAAEYWLANK